MKSPENLNFSPESLNGATTRMVLVVDDPDSVFQQAVASGAKEVVPVDDKEYGWRVGTRGRSVWTSLGDWEADRVRSCRASLDRTGEGAPVPT